MAQPPVSRETVLKLIQKKDDIEREIKELGQVLESQRNIGLHTPLVDKEGYPRLDVDVYQVRHARQKIICLQNDHKAIMKEIENNLHILHAQHREEQGNFFSSEEEMSAVVERENLKAFCKVDKVMRNSPAESAGLLPGDHVLKFGSISSTNLRNLQDLSSVVQHSLGRSTQLIVMRNNKYMQLNLIPKTWSGQGLLGCNLIPI